MVMLLYKVGGDHNLKGVVNVEGTCNRRAGWVIKARGNGAATAGRPHLPAPVRPGMLGANGAEEYRSAQRVLELGGKRAYPFRWLRCSWTTGFSGRWWDTQLSFVSGYACKCNLMCLTACRLGSTLCHQRVNQVFVHAVSRRVHGRSEVLFCVAWTVVAEGACVICVGYNMVANPI